MKQVHIMASLFLIGGLFLAVGTQVANAQWSNDTSMGNSTNSTSRTNATNATSPISTTDADGVGGIAGLPLGDGG